MSAVKPAVLLVDGYNIIGLCPKLQQVRDRQGLEESRRHLIEALTNYSAYHGHETEVVFDAQYQSAAGNREQITDQMQVFYTEFGQTADSYIERSCAVFFREDLRRFQKRLIVATSDRAQWLTAVGYGAEWMSARQLAQDTGLSLESVRQHHQPKTRSKQRFLSSSLDDSARDKLANLRQHLWQQGR
ncbi:NYN domain-containing protein [Prochlorothrix hollandica]|uniref:RNA-binding protein containing a PIN domain protein n=1 Tax=Prochlorothrix hollandica PCC 9006 = CALU 1027 TaxID=317619 RepID=A0A0M2PXZ0_PROHO|nr:NYN domain-containing protein [Prochlorothrix hollandica]KKJ01040.1 RNA-binding protein containing a PIN domain protein [Prochlorothrix hollandica PCC 9006 = CALU 1027]